MREHIDSCHKESKICAAYPEYSTAYFNKVENITIDSDSITPQKKKMGERQIVRNIMRYLF